MIMRNKDSFVNYFHRRIALPYIIKLCKNPDIQVKNQCKQNKISEETLSMFLLLCIIIASVIKILLFKVHKNAFLNQSLK